MFKKTDLLFLILALHLSACSVPSKLDKDSPKNWSMWGGNYAGTRYSPLQEINSDNVQRLKLLWAFPTKIAGGHEGGPLIVDNIIYIHTPFPNRVYALDQKTRQEIWQYTPDQSAAKGLSEIWAKSNSGLAYANGKLFLQQNDTTLTALDATTGKVLWQTKNGDPKKGMSNSNAPIVIKNKVITGISDTFYGARGFLAAYDINTGTLIWKGYSTGADKDTLIKAGYTTTWRKGQVTPLDKDESLASWQAEQWKTGGGTTEGWYSYDPELNLVYYGSSRPAPGNPVQRPGDNKWTSALWARDADTGIVKWVYQMTPHDEWGYDGYNESVLLDQSINGKVRKTLVHFDENGVTTQRILPKASGH